MEELTRKVFKHKKKSQSPNPAFATRKKKTPLYAQYFFSFFTYKPESISATTVVPV